MKVLVITVSDRASKGVYEDKSGPLIVESLKGAYPDAEITSMIVPDNRDDLLNALNNNLENNIILTNGGTGLSPRDITPEVTREFCDKAIPGISEIIRSESYKQTPNAMLSRGFAGIKDNTIIINLPGSPKAVEFCMKIILPILDHALDMIRGKPH